MRYLAIALILMGCQSWQPSPDRVITPNECKRACYPQGMISLDAIEGACKCRND